jgi:nitric oxide reductase NorE protein
VKQAGEDTLTIDTERRQRISAPQRRTSVPGDYRAKAVAERRWVPGEAGVWALIFTDLTVFTVYFIDVMLQWRQHPDMFARGHAATSLTAGILNTFFLLTASLFIALGVQTVRTGKVDSAQRLFLGGGVAGAAFIVNKYFEWSVKLDHGHTPLTDNFFQLYFVITGIHLLHVCIAMTLLWFVRRRAAQVVGTPTPDQSRFIENCATYWHMVDLLWLGILALFYLIG